MERRRLVFLNDPLTEEQRHLASLDGMTLEMYAQLRLGSVRARAIDMLRRHDQALQSAAVKLDLPSRAFLEVWQNYPVERQGARRRAWEAWKRARVGVGEPALLAAIRRRLPDQAATEAWEKEGRQWMPTLENYIEQGYWEG